MNKVYTRINWENEPSVETAINETNLNAMDMAINEIDNRVVEHNTTKADKTQLSSLISNWTIDEDSGVVTVTKFNGEKIIFDLNIEKIPVSFTLSDDGVLSMTTDDGTVFSADIGSMIPVLTFSDSEEIAVNVTGSGVNKIYSFSIKQYSITEDKLQPNFLADCSLQATRAMEGAVSAMEFAKEAEESAQRAESQASKFDFPIKMENGGTGQSDGKSGIIALINTLGTADSVPNDDTEIMTQHVGDGSNTTWYRRKMGRLWDYIYDKISSKLKLTTTGYGGKAAMATADGDGNDIVNNYAPKKSWDCVTSVGNWSRVCKLNGYGNYLLKITFSQNTQAISYVYMIGTAYGEASIFQLGSTGFVSNSALKVRLVGGNSTYGYVNYYVEVLNEYGYNDATNVTANLTIQSLNNSDSTSSYVTYTSHGGENADATAVASIDSVYNGMVASNFYGNLIGNADTATTATNVTGVEGTGTANRHIWFSDSTTETQRAYNDSLKYKPSTNTITANISGNAKTATNADKADVATTATQLTYETIFKGEITCPASTETTIIGGTDDYDKETWQSYNYVGVSYSSNGVGEYRLFPISAFYDYATNSPIGCNLSNNGHLYADEYGSVYVYGIVVIKIYEITLFNEAFGTMSYEDIMS